jgi:glycosyltransferase involved in cell wall biosynthesis
VRICCLANANSIHTKRWASALAKQGHDIRILSYQAASVPGAEVIKIPSTRLKLTPLLAVQASRWVRAEVEKWSPDIIHAHFITDYGWLATCAGIHPRVITAHGSDVLIWPNKSLLLRAVTALALRSADKTISVAKHMTPILKGLGAPLNRIQYIPNWVDEEINDSNKRHKISFGYTRILSTRSLCHIYDIWTLAKAIPTVLDSARGVEFWIVGDGQEKPKLKEYIASLRASNRVNLPGALPHNEVVRAYNEANIYVSTAISDGLSVSLLEAMACGAFPIVTNIPANREVVRHQHNGLLFNSSDPTYLSTMIIEAINNPEMQSRANKENIKLIQEQYREMKVVPQLEDMYGAVSNGIRVQS